MLSTILGTIGIFAYLFLRLFFQIIILTALITLILNPLPQKVRETATNWIKIKNASLLKILLLALIVTLELLAFFVPLGREILLDIPPLQLLSVFLSLWYLYRYWKERSKMGMYRLFAWLLIALSVITLGTLPFISELIENQRS